MEPIHYLIIALILVLGGCGYVLYLIVRSIRTSNYSISALTDTLGLMSLEMHSGLKAIGQKLEQLDLQSDIAESVREHCRMIENIRIPAIRLETHPFRVNITKELKAKWIMTRQEKIKMVEQQMMTAEQLFDYHEKLKEDFLVLERTGKKDDAALMKAKIEAVEMVMGVKI